MEYANFPLGNGIRVTETGSGILAEFGPEKIRFKFSTPCFTETSKIPAIIAILGTRPTVNTLFFPAVLKSCFLISRMPSRWSITNGIDYILTCSPRFRRVSCCCETQQAFFLALWFSEVKIHTCRWLLSVVFVACAYAGIFLSSDKTTKGVLTLTWKKLEIARLQ